MSVPNSLAEYSLRNTKRDPVNCYTINERLFATETISDAAGSFCSDGSRRIIDDLRLKSSVAESEAQIASPMTSDHQSVPQDEITWLCLGKRDHPGIATNVLSKKSKTGVNISPNVGLRVFVGDYTKQSGEDWTSTSQNEEGSVNFEFKHRQRILWTIKQHVRRSTFPLGRSSSTVLRASQNLSVKRSMWKRRSLGITRSKLRTKIKNKTYFMQNGNEAKATWGTNAAFRVQENQFNQSVLVRTPNASRNVLGYAIKRSRCTMFFLKKPKNEMTTSDSGSQTEGYWSNCIASTIKAWNEKLVITNSDQQTNEVSRLSSSASNSSASTSGLSTLNSEPETNGRCWSSSTIANIWCASNNKLPNTNSDSQTNEISRPSSTTSFSSSSRVSTFSCGSQTNRRFWSSSAIASIWHASNNKLATSSVSPNKEISRVSSTGSSLCASNDGQETLSCGTQKKEISCSSSMANIACNWNEKLASLNSDSQINTISRSLSTVSISCASSSGLSTLSCEPNTNGRLWSSSAIASIWCASNNNIVTSNNGPQSNEIPRSNSTARISSASKIALPTSSRELQNNERPYSSPIPSNLCDSNNKLAALSFGTHTNEISKSNSTDRISSASKIAQAISSKNSQNNERPWSSPIPSIWCFSYSQRETSGSGTHIYERSRPNNGASVRCSSNSRQENFNTAQQTHQGSMTSSNATTRCFLNKRLAFSSSSQQTNDKYCSGANFNSWGSNSRVETRSFGSETYESVRSSSSASVRCASCHRLTNASIGPQTHQRSSTRSSGSTRSSNRLAVPSSSRVSHENSSSRQTGDVSSATSDLSALSFARKRESQEYIQIKGDQAIARLLQEDYDAEARAERRRVEYYRYNNPSVGRQRTSTTNVSDHTHHRTRYLESLSTHLPPYDRSFLDFCGNLFVTSNPIRSLILPLYSLYEEESSDSDDDDPLLPVNPRAPDNDIKNCPTFVYPGENVSTNSDNEVEMVSDEDVEMTSITPEPYVERENIVDKCTICLCVFEHGDIVRNLPCLHYFHKDCIDPWLKTKGNCPICRVKI